MKNLFLLSLSALLYFAGWVVLGRPSVFHYAAAMALIGLAASKFGDAADNLLGLGR